MAPKERVLDLEAESLGSGLALPFTVVIWREKRGITHLIYKMGTVLSSG